MSQLLLVRLSFLERLVLAFATFVTFRGQFDSVVYQLLRFVRLIFLLLLLILLLLLGLESHGLAHEPLLLVKEALEDLVKLVLHGVYIAGSTQLGIRLHLFVFFLTDDSVVGCGLRVLGLRAE